MAPVFDELSVNVGVLVGSLVVVALFGAYYGYRYATDPSQVSTMDLLPLLLFAVPITISGHALLRRRSNG